MDVIFVGVLHKYKIGNKLYLFSESAVEVLIKTNAWKDELKLKHYAEEIYDLNTGSILKHRYALWKAPPVKKTVRTFNCFGSIPETVEIEVDDND